ncbi:hypothetical protein [Mycobacteroides abscessus]|uniref:hypothetical protein n=1 Tax=Mycobacteroides abscessus TaxID=36809 RepID=UPI0009CEF4C4|nr:hypothetical protein [Mycobacteroides abscessus]SKK33292.1 Uncharacterised protein [Mycobacteroides abscessus subsp. abscessus]
MTRIVNVPARLLVSLGASVMLAVAGVGLQLCWWLNWSVPSLFLLGLLVLFVVLQCTARWVKGSRAVSVRWATVFGPNAVRGWVAVIAGSFSLVIVMAVITEMTGVWLWGFMAVAAAVTYAAVDVVTELRRMTICGP